MSNFSKKHTRIFSCFLALFLIFSSSTPFADNLQDVNNNSLNKITTQVLENFSHEEYTGVIVYLNDQVDTENMQYQSRNIVVQELKETAEETQEDLIDYIEKQKLRGKVEEYTPYYIVNAIYVKATEEVIRKISKMREVKKIYPNSKIEVDFPEVSQAHIDSNDNNVEWNIKQIGADKVWNEFGIDGKGVVIGILDSGVWWEHEALKEKWRGYNPNDPENPNPEGNWFDATSNKKMPYDDYEQCHGTHVTGTILGQDREGKNKIGVAPGAKWIAAKALTSQGGYSNWLLAAGEWMLAPNGDPSLAPDIINNSWGGGQGLDEWYRDMVQAWRAAGIFPVFASGNERFKPEALPGSVSIPANYPESFAVGAVDNENKLALFSQRGPSPYEGEIKPEVVAPGLNIRSSVIGGYEGGWNGTSMAAPHVSGTAALLLSANKNISVDELEDIITKAAVSLTDEKYTENPNQGYGYGLVNAYEAVKSVTTTNGLATINGKVLAKVDSINEPQIIHEPIKYIFENGTIPIKARIKGDVAIKEVELLIKSIANDKWDAIPMNIELGSHINGIYTAVVPIQYTNNEQFIYKIKAEDYKGNILQTGEYTAIKSLGILPDEYETDFSEYPVGWEFSGDWEWGEASSLYQMYGKRNMIGTNLIGRYSPNTISTLEMPPIDLSGNEFKHVVLKANHFKELDPYFEDTAKILISTDNRETWQELKSFKGQYNHYWDKTSYLEEIAIDLTKYIGTENPVHIAFELKSGDYNQMRGWYLDSVSLVGTDTEAPNSPQGVEVQKYPIGVTLSWTAPWSGDVVGYKVYRSLEEDGEYELVGETVSRNYIDKEVEVGQTYYYKVSAIDIFENESILSRRSPSITVEEKHDIVYFSDFEENDGEFTSGGENSDWEWGESVGAGPCEAFTGSKLWGTNLTGMYSSDGYVYIESQEIDLPEEGYLYLNFHSWLDGNVSDYGVVLISVYDDGKWSAWRDLGGPYKAEYEMVYNGMVPDVVKKPVKWQEYSKLKLNSYRGKKVKLQFVFYSNGSNTDSTGWYIDDILVSCKKKNEISTEELNVDLNKEEVLEEQVLHEGIVDKNVLEEFVLQEESLDTSKQQEDILEENEEKLKQEISEGDVQEEAKLQEENFEEHDLEKSSIEEDNIYLETEGIAEIEEIANIEEMTETEEDVMPEIIIFDNFKERPQQENLELFSIDDEKTIQIPVDAKISIVGTGYSTRTSLIDGTYELNPFVTKTGETLKIKVEAYGYGSQEVEVELIPGKRVTQDFILEKLSKGDVKGKLIDEITKEPIEGASIKIKEDLKVKPVFSDENGEFELENVYEGEKTLLITKTGYDTKEIKITSDLIDVREICLSKSKNISVEIAYDDGTAERGVVEKNNMGGIAGTAIRITPSGKGKVLGTNIYFTDSSYPLPGGNRIGVVLFTADERMKPKDMIKAPLFFEIERGKWNYLDLTRFDFSTDSDFFIATVQEKEWCFMPAIGVDEDTNYDNRSFLYNEMRFYELPLDVESEIQGTLMIRAIMEYEKETPQITNIPKFMYTNEDTILLEGSTNKAGSINIYNNGVKVKEITIVDNEFSAEIELVEGENKIVLNSVKHGKEMKTDSATIVKDTILPVIKINSPQNKEVFKNSKIKVTGNIIEEHLNSVLVNDKTVSVDEDGNFVVELELKEGESEIIVKAIDKAGNTKTDTRIVYLNTKSEEPGNSSGGVAIGGGGVVANPSVEDNSQKVEKSKEGCVISSEISTTGRMLKDKEGSIELRIEEGTFNKKTEIKVSKIDEKEIGNSKNLKKLGEIYEISSSVKKLNKPVKAKFKYDKSKLKDIDEELIGVYKLNEKTSEWEFIGGKIDKKNNTVMAEIEHSSKYTVMASTKTFNDINKHWAKHEIEVMAARGIVDGIDGSIYKPQGEITKAEFAKILVKLLNLSEESDSGTFTDISDKWYSGYIEAALKAGIINAKETEFSPNQAITREEMAVMIANTIKYVDKEKAIGTEVTFNDKDDISKEALEGVSIASKNKIIKGKNEKTFAPKDLATRGEAATMIYRLLKVIDEI